MGVKPFCSALTVSILNNGTALPWRLLLKINENMCGNIRHKQSFLRRFAEYVETGISGKQEFSRVLVEDLAAARER